jgi:chromosome segregation ATPase
MMRPSSLFVAFFALVAIIGAADDAHNPNRSPRKGPITHVKQWIRGMGSRIQTHLENRKREQLLVNCQISDVVAHKRLSTELLQLKQQKTSIENDLTRLKSAGDKARRELSNTLLEKNRAATAAKGAKNTSSSSSSSSAEGPADALPAASLDSFVSFEVLSFICFGLFVAFLSALHMMQEAKTRANKLTQRLKLTTPSAVVEKEAEVYQKRVAEMEAQGRLDRDKAAATQRQLEQAESEVEAYQYRIAELEKELQGAAGAATATASTAAAEVVTLRARVAEAQAAADTQARACAKLKEEKDVAVAELARVSAALDAAEGPAAQQEKKAQAKLAHAAKAERDQMALALEETRRELAVSVQRIVEAEERGKKDTETVTAERDELRISKERTDHCFLEIEAQLALEKRKVKDHVASIRDLEQKLTETERRKGISFNRPSVLGGGGSGSGDTDGDVAALTARVRDLMRQADSDKQQIAELTSERDSLALVSLPTGAGSAGESRSQVQVGVLTKQRDMLVASKKILEDRIAELNSEVKWVDEDREKLQQKEQVLHAKIADLEAKVAAQATELAGVTALARRNAALEAAALEDAAQLALLRQSLADAIAARDALDVDLQRDRLFLKEVMFFSDVLLRPSPLSSLLSSLTHIFRSLSLSPYRRGTVPWCWKVR